MDQSGWEKFKKDKESLLLLVALFLIIVIAAPIKMILLFASIIVSVCVGIIMNRVLEKINISRFHQTISSGIVSGTMGFIIGLYLGESLSPYAYT